MEHNATSPNETREDDVYVLDRKDISAILYAVEIDDKPKLSELMDPLHAADIACLLYTSPSPRD